MRGPRDSTLHTIYNQSGRKIRLTAFQEPICRRRMMLMSNQLLSNHTMGGAPFATALGFETSASGMASFASGWSTSASGRYSVATGV